MAQISQGNTNLNNANIYGELKIKDKTDDTLKEVTTKEYVDNLVKTVEHALIEKIYPVGSIFYTLEDTDPSTLFEDTQWEKLPAGRTIISEGTSDWGEIYTLGQLGGEATHILTEEEMPEHTHSGNISEAELQGTLTYVSQEGDPTGVFTRTDSWNTKIVATGQSDNWGFNTTFNGTHTHDINIDNAGGGQPHNNMSPYIVMNIWKRIA